MTAFRPRVLLDVDGVLANFLEPCLALINDMWGTDYKLAPLHAWNLFDHLKVPKELEDDVYYRMKKEGWCESIPVYPGAVEGVAELRRIADVHICTSPMGGRHWVHERNLWLDKHFGFKARDITHTSAKYICKANALIDDKIENLMVWNDHHPRGSALCWNQVSNTYFSYPGTRINSWSELAGFVSCLEEW